MRALPVPRLLPVTMAALAVLLAVKSASLVRAAAPAGHAETPKPAETHLAETHPAETHPAETHPAETHAGPARPPAGPAAAAGAMPAQAEAPNMAATAPIKGGPPEEASVSASERALLLELRRRRGDLDVRETALAAREGIAGAADKRLAIRLDELAALQRRLEALEAARRERDETGWRGLVRVYETMKPRDAATIFNDLDMPVLLQVVDRMKETKAAPVLAAMLPDRARLLTAELSSLRARSNQPEAASATAPPLAIKPTTTSR